MAKVMTDESNYSAIASQIRSKLGVSTRYKPSEMAAAIGSISGVSSSDNGKVVVDGQLTQQTSRSVSQNGTYDTTTNNEVTVNVSGGGGGYEAVVVFDSSSGISQGYTYADVYNGTEGSTPSYDANGRIQVIGGANNRKFAGFIIDLSNVEYVVLEGEFNNINNTTGAIVESDVSTIKTKVSGSITSGFDAYCTAYVADTTITLPIDVSALSGTYYVGIIGYESGWNSWLSSVKLYGKASR